MTPPILKIFLIWISWLSYVWLSAFLLTYPANSWMWIPILLTGLLGAIAAGIATSIIADDL